MVVAGPLEDMRTLESDSALSNSLLKLGELQGTDAVGDWLRHSGGGEGLTDLSRINQRIVATRIRQTGIIGHTLDDDASQIVAEKKPACFTYKGERATCR